jgi:ADP-ribose pyrophosphatase
MIKKIHENPIYNDVWLTLIKDDITFSNGERGTYVKLKRKKGVGVVLVNPDQKLVLVKLLRYPTQMESWEIPGGGIEPNQPPEDAAICEINEEVGISIEKSKLESLGLFYPLNSLSDEHVTLYITNIAHQSLPQHKPDDDEIISVQLIPITKAIQMIKEGSINDAMTALSILLASKRLSLGTQ